MDLTVQQRSRFVRLLHDMACANSAERIEQVERNTRVALREALSTFRDRNFEVLSDAELKAIAESENRLLSYELNHYLNRVKSTYTERLSAYLARAQASNNALDEHERS